MTSIAEAYVHLTPFSLDHDKIERIGKRIDSIAYDTALRIYPEIKFNIDVTIEDGSLKTWVTVGAYLFGIYGGIANYKGFKESINEICNDARLYGYDVCGKIVDLSGANKNQVFRTEKRLGTPGRISRLIKRLEQFDQNFSNPNSSSAIREIRLLRDELANIADDLDNNSREVTLNTLSKKFPEVFPSTKVTELRSTSRQADLPDDLIYVRPVAIVQRRSLQNSRLLYYNSFSASSPPSEKEIRDLPDR